LRDGRWGDRQFEARDSKHLAWRETSSVVGMRGQLVCNYADGFVGAASNCQGRNRQGRKCQGNAVDRVRVCREYKERGGRQWKRLRRRGGNARRGGDGRFSSFRMRRLCCIAHSLTAKPNTLRATLAFPCASIRFRLSTRVFCVHLLLSVVCM
jgi:hypothetical protein